MSPVLISIAGPIGRVLASMALSLLTDKMVKRLTYRALKAVVERYRSNAYASPDVKDDKTAEMLMGVMKDVKEAWQIDE